MTGRLVALREITADDADVLAAPGNTGEFNQLGPVDPDHKPDSHRAAIVTRDGVLVGSLSWHLVRYGPDRGSRAWNLGINLLPAARGRGYGAEAQRLLAEHLLASTDIDRIEASTDVENLAEQRSLEKAGFTRDGVLRKAQFRAGARHDLVVYSILRDEV